MCWCGFDHNHFLFLTAQPSFVEFYPSKIARYNGFLNFNYELAFLKRSHPFPPFPKKEKISLTLLVPGQGHNGPGNWNKVCHIHNIRARSIKILDFVPFYVWMVLENSFLEFVFEIFCKIEKQNLIEGSPLWKKDWGYQKTFFFKQNFFLFQSVLYTFLLASFWGVYSLRPSFPNDPRFMIWLRGTLT